MEIDFLSNNLNDESKKIEKEEKIIEWSKPELKKISEPKKDLKKDNFFKIFFDSLKPFKKQSKNDIIASKKIKNSRKDILKDIKQKKQKQLKTEISKKKQKNRLFKNILEKDEKKLDKNVYENDKEIIKKESSFIKDMRNKEEKKEIVEKKREQTEPKIKKTKNKKEGWLSWFYKNKRTIELQKEVKSMEKFQEERKDKEIKKEASPAKKEKNKGQEKDNIKQLNKNKWEESSTLETNLIKKEVIVFFNWSKNITILIVLILLSISIIGIVYRNISYINEQKEIELSVLEDDLNKLNKEIDYLNENFEKNILFKNKLSSVKYLLDNHIYWTNFFEFLEDNTLTSVYYSFFNGDTEGNYTLSAFSENFSAIEAQVSRMLMDENGYVLEVSVDSGSLGSDSSDIGTDNSEEDMVSFDLSLILDPKIFTK